MPTKNPKPQKSEPLKSLPKPPGRLDVEGKRYWKEIGTELISISALTPLHLRTLEVLCITFSQYLKLNDWCENNPELAVAETEKGYVFEHPNVRLRQKAFENLTKLWAKFGLTPAALQTIGKHGGGNAPSNPILGFAATKYDDDE